MKFKIQVVAVSDDGREQTREIASLERDDLQPETLGLTLAESKVILKGLQEIVVQRKHAWGGAGLFYRKLSA